VHSKALTRWRQVAQRESSLCYLDSLIKLNIIYGPQGPNLHYMAQKYKAQVYSTWPKCKAEIILNYSKQFIQIRGLFLNTLFSPKGFLHVCIWARAVD